MDAAEKRGNGAHRSSVRPIDISVLRGFYTSRFTILTIKWEMAIKNGLGKMPLPSAPIAEEIQEQGFQWLNINPYVACHQMAITT